MNILWERKYFRIKDFSSAFYFITVCFCMTVMITTYSDKTVTVQYPKYLDNSRHISFLHWFSCFWSSHHPLQLFSIRFYRFLFSLTEQESVNKLPITYISPLLCSIYNRFIHTEYIQNSVKLLIFFMVGVHFIYCHIMAITLTKEQVICILYVP